MRLVLAAVGRLRTGPEAALTADYLRRATEIGRKIALSPADLVEVEAKTMGDRAREAELLAAAIPAGGVVALLDERGRSLGSRAFAAQLAAWRDAGRPAAAFLIGGADGHDPALAARADVVLAFGPQTWPHRLARAMLAEQLYRAVSILAGAPYHRD